jgi:hypothetical protein
MKTIGLLVLLLPFLAACSSPNSRINPGADLSGYSHIWVEHRLADGHSVDEIIARSLRTLGYDASCGPRTLMPDNAEVILSYDDHWTDDFTSYMIQIAMTLHTTRTDKLLASGVYNRPSITGHTPDAMIDALLRQFFQPKVPPVPQTPPVS